MARVFLNFKEKKWVLISVIVWLIICQSLFLMVQSGIGQKVVDSVENQLRQELDFSDFHYLSRSITDYNTKGTIKCSKITKTYPESLPILNLEYMSNSCSTNLFLLNGLKYNVELKALNGDIFQFEFVALNPTLFYLALWCFRIIGFVLVLLTFYIFKLKEEKNKILIAFEKNISTAMMNQAQQVAHDIRSPLSALNLMLPFMNVLPEDNRLIIRQSIQRINDIANDLLNKESSEKSVKIKNTSLNSPIELSNTHNNIFILAPAIDSIVSEKRIQFRDKINVQIEVDLSESYGLFINFNQVELKRILSNLINNSVEAFPNNTGKVEIKVLGYSNTIRIQIKDNGKGIPQNILKTLGQKGVSFQKETDTNSGTRLGLFHAKSTIEKYGGKFEILSELGLGTYVNINISPAVSPEWFIEKILISKNTSIISVDDDVSIHGLWRNRFRSLQNKLIDSVEIDFMSFTSTNVFTDWFSSQDENKIKNSIFIIDYEFINQNINGLDLIEKLNLHQNLKTILVTSRYDDPNIQNKCIDLKLKLIPKSQVGYIPIFIEKD